MCRILLALVAAVAFVGGGKVPAQEQELFVGEVEMPSLKWGRQKANIEITNNTEYLKFIIVETKIDFTDSYLTPSRKARSSHFLEPHAHKVLHPEIEIPGNYGKAALKLVLYDVVDTLDAILPGQKFYEQPFSINSRMPDEVVDYLQEKITLPPRVEQHPYFDNEFGRMLFLFIDEGKSPEEIAELTKADVSFVKRQIQLMVDEKYLKAENDSYALAFPVISVEEAEQARKLADEASALLAGIISANMGSYWRVINKLVETGVIPPDSNDVMSGASLLYRPYPVVSALLLWYELGQKFVAPSEPFVIYNGTDICNADNIKYMYAVQGGDYFNGNHFYALLHQRGTHKILFADHSPEIKCPDDFMLLKKRKRAVRWIWAEKNRAQYYVVDTVNVRLLLDSLGQGTDSLLTAAHDSVNNLALKHGHAGGNYGYRYWFWNLVATAVLQRLTEGGVIERVGHGHFEINSARR